MESVNIVTASELLGISRQRIQQLIYAERVIGAFKTRKGWQIPLYQGMPRIIPAKRGVKGTWRLKRGKKKIIHINKQTIGQNNREKRTEPVIIVRKGDDTFYGHEAFFEGKCKVVYNPENDKKHGGAKVWIEVPETKPVVVIAWQGTEKETVTIVA